MTRPTELPPFSSSSGIIASYRMARIAPVANASMVATAEKTPEPAWIIGGLLVGGVAVLGLGRRGCPSRRSEVAAWHCVGG
ncbi:MAG: hypothetical protein ACXV2H_01325 [Actinomycetes bacterium]